MEELQGDQVVITQTVPLEEIIANAQIELAHIQEEISSRAAKANEIILRLQNLTQ